MPWDRQIEPLLARYPVLRAIGQTPLVPVDVLGTDLPGVEVLAKMECLNPGGSLKDRPVLRMLLSALASSRLRPGKVILDSSSGNAGIAYAMIGRIIGYPVEIVIPDNASTERKKRLIAHGARLIFTDALKGYDEALREVHRRALTDPEHYFFCDQYSNDDNWRAHYETTAAEILEQTRGNLTHVVLGVGTGGTSATIGRYSRFRRRFPVSKASNPWEVPRTSSRRSWTRASSTSASPSPVTRPTACASSWPAPASSSDSRQEPTWWASNGSPAATAPGDS